MNGDLLDIATMRAGYLGLSNVSFVQSPSAEALPGELGQFEFINLGAVYEHLLPHERPRVLGQLWSVLKLGGVMFVNQLPHRFYPIEFHTSGLLLLNCLPDYLAYLVARRLSPRVGTGATWHEMLRNGIRGGTARSVKRDLESAGGKPLHSYRRGWAVAVMRISGTWTRLREDLIAKRAMRVVFKVIGRISGSPFTAALSLAFQKRA
jgi:ubiquinone/menaquinone biosynthesis C-methylase UbiE